MNVKYSNIFFLFYVYKYVEWIKTTDFSFLTINLHKTQLN